MLNSTIVIVDVWFPQNVSSTIDSLLATSNAVSFEESNNVSTWHIWGLMLLCLCIKINVGLRFQGKPTTFQTLLFLAVILLQCTYIVLWVGTIYTVSEY